MTPGGEGRQRRRTPIRSLPRMAPPTRGSGGIAPALQPPPQLRGRPEVRPHGALRAGPGGGGPPPARPLNTISAPDGPIDPGHCGYRPCPQPPPQFGGQPETRPSGHFGYGPSGGGAPPPGPPHYDLCPRRPPPPSSPPH